MGRFLNPGNELFKESINSEIYVDKTDILEFLNRQINTRSKYICVSRPRRFGKSMTADMIAAYYDIGCDSQALFDGLKISSFESYKKHLNRHYVISLDIQWFRSNALCEGNINNILTDIQNSVIAELREHFDEYMDKKERSLPDVLSHINDRSGIKFIVVIDEWDCLFREEKLDTKLQDMYINLLRGLFKGNLADKFISLAYITGILPIKKYGVESALNNFREYTMINPGRMSKYIGFTENEVKTLCNKYNMDFDTAQRWYDGYTLAKKTHIYNPQSVVEAMLEGEYCSYWTNTEAYSSLKQYIEMNFDGLKDDIVAMLAGEQRKVNTASFENDMTSFKSKDDVLTLLIHLGYLGYDPDWSKAFVPNMEIREQFASTIAAGGWAVVSDSLKKSDELLDAVLNGDSENVARLIDEAHTDNTSILAYNNENSLSNVISIAFYSARRYYTLIREYPSGKGFADVVFVPYKNVDMPAVVVELKWDVSAGAAIKQIKDRDYVQSLKGYSGRIILVGINYDRNTKKHTCKIENFDYMEQ